jgi:hypothetical protein
MRHGRIRNTTLLVDTAENNERFAGGSREAGWMNVPGLTW